MPIGDEFFAWATEMLRAEHRAEGGEPCRKCRSPIPANATPGHRDQNVCSLRCSSLLRRQWRRDVDAGKAPWYLEDERTKQRHVQEMMRVPRRFATLPDAEFPYEHSRWPVPGDVVERHGHETSYRLVDNIYDLPGEIVEKILNAADLGAHLMAAEHRASGVLALYLTDWSYRPHGAPIGLGIHDGSMVFKLNDGDRIAPDGDLYFSTELFKGIEPGGRAYTWQAPHFSPFKAADLATPAYFEWHASKARASTARSAYWARMIANGNMPEGIPAIDPHEIYERDGWICGVCGREIERTLAWPHPGMATLDHIRPLARQGLHTRGNLQPAHLTCNITKGDHF